MEDTAKKKEEGVLSIEAAIVLTTVLFLIMFVVDIGCVYRAQNYVTHGMLQTAKSIAVMSYEMEDNSTVEDIAEAVEQFFLKLTGQKGRPDARLAGAGKKDNMEQVVRLLYGSCAAGSEEKANQTLERMGLENGVGSIDFTDTAMEDGGKELLICASYKVTLPFQVFGYKNVTLRQRVRSRMWREVE